MAHIIPDQHGETRRPLADLLNALREITPQRIALDRREFTSLQAARTLGATWDQIADALGHGNPEQRYEELRARFAPPGPDAP